MKFKADFSVFNKRCLLVALAAFAVYLLLILALAVASYFLNTSYEAIAAATYAITVVCLIFASGLNASRAGSKGWLNGLVAGAIFLVLLFLFSSFVSGGFDFNIFLLKLPIFLLISLISGIIGINFK